VTSARVPRDLWQEQVIRALLRGGGVEDKAAGKGSHRRVTMPNGNKVFVPAGRVKMGMLRGIISEAGLSPGQFNSLL